MALQLLLRTLDSILGIKLPHALSALLFTLILGLPSLFGTKFVDYFNRGLFGVKGFLLLMAIAVMLPHVEMEKLIPAQELGHTKYLLAAAPIFILAFFYHCVVPSLRSYIGDKPKELKKIVIWGSVFSLSIYLLWLASTLGTVPVEGEHSFTSLAKNNGNVGEFAHTVITVCKSKWITFSLHRLC